VKCVWNRRCQRWMMMCIVDVAAKWAAADGRPTHPSRAETSGRYVHLSTTVSYQQDRRRQILCKWSLFDIMCRCVCFNSDPCQSSLLSACSSEIFVSARPRAVDRMVESRVQELVRDVVVWRVAEDASGEDLAQYCDGESRRRLDGARWVPRQERPLSRLVSCSCHSAHFKLELFSSVIWRAYRICQVGLLQ